jgi:hypothetical protein
MKECAEQGIFGVLFRNTVLVIIRGARIVNGSIMFRNHRYETNNKAMAI